MLVRESGRGATAMLKALKVWPEFFHFLKKEKGRRTIMTKIYLNMIFG